MTSEAGPAPRRRRRATGPGGGHGAALQTPAARRTRWLRSVSSRPPRRVPPHDQRLACGWRRPRSRSGRTPSSPGTARRHPADLTDADIARRGRQATADEAFEQNLDVDLSAHAGCLPSPRPCRRRGRGDPTPIRGDLAGAWPTGLESGGRRAKGVGSGWRRSIRTWGPGSPGCASSDPARPLKARSTPSTPRRSTTRSASPPSTPGATSPPTARTTAGTGPRPILILYTTGRRSGRIRRNPLLYLEHGGERYLIGSKGGADLHPEWYLNLCAEPRVHVRVMAEVYEADARTSTATSGRRCGASSWPAIPMFDDYQQATAREIPVVHLARRAEVAR